MVGTAGHVDHGKSTLIRALTGIDPDRLEEERRRGMTIDLGFAHLDLPDGRRVGIVDVPGHARFLHNMLAGVHGMDAVLLVVAADEGVMPQTREHLDILELLGVRSLLVALTKVDLVAPELAEMARADVLAELARREIAADVVAVAAPQGRGLEELRAGITRLAAAARSRDVGLPRLPLDRAFVLAGFGAVATGSLVDGGLRRGQELELVPASGRVERVRLRGLQQHGREVEAAAPGARVAANLQGVDAADLHRGQVLAAPGTLRPTMRLDLQIRVLPGAPPLRHGQRVAVHAGTAEAQATVVALEAEAVEPGGTGFVQLRLARPVAVRDGDRVVLRRPSPRQTLGGGAVVDASPPARRRSQAGTVDALTRRLSAGGRVAEELAKSGGGAEAEELAASLGAPLEDVAAALSFLEATGEAVRAGATRFHARRRWLDLERAAGRAVEEFHRSNPLRAGMPRESLAVPLGLRGRALADAVEAMVRRGVLVAPGPAPATPEPGSPPAPPEPGLSPPSAVQRPGALVALPGHRPRLTNAEREAVERALAALAEAPLSPPPAFELSRLGLSDPLRRHLEETGQVVRVAPDLLMLPEALVEARSRLVRHLAGGAAVTVAEARDLLGSSRRTVVPLLEHFDATQLTLREGDLRRLRPGG